LTVKYIIHYHKEIKQTIIKMVCIQEGQEAQRFHLFLEDQAVREVPPDPFHLLVQQVPTLENTCEYTVIFE